MAKKLSNFNRLRKQVVSENKEAGVKATPHDTNSTIAIAYYKETMMWLDEQESKGHAYPQVREAARALVQTKKGQLRKDFSNTRQRIAAVERLKNLPEASKVVPIRNFASSHRGTPLMAEFSAPTHYVQVGERQTRAQAVASEFATKFRAYQKDYRKAKRAGDVTFHTGDALYKALGDLAIMYPDVFTIGDIMDNVGAFKINLNKVAKYKNDRAFYDDMVRMLGYSHFTKEGEIWQEQDTARYRANLETPKLPIAANVTNPLVRAGVDLNELERLMNKSLVYHLYFSKRYQESDQAQSGRIDIVNDTLTEAKKDDSNIRALAVFKLEMIVNATDYTDEKKLKELEDWLYEYVGKL